MSTVADALSWLADRAGLGLLAVPDHAPMSGAEALDFFLRAVVWTLIVCGATFVLVVALIGLAAACHGAILRGSQTREGRAR